MLFKANQAIKEAAQLLITQSDRSDSEVVYAELKSLKSALDAAELDVARHNAAPDSAVIARAKYDDFFDRMIVNSGNPVIISDINS